MAKAARPKPLQGEPLIIQMGPQHPSTHGVLRVELETDGEIVSKATPHIGYLHRCKEKIGEKIPYEQYVPYSDRMDYLAAINTNWTWAMAVEKLAGIEVPARAEWIRVFVGELNRIASHLVFQGCFGLDLGAITPFLHCFREREMVLDILEELSGGRLCFNYMRIGGVAGDMTPRAMQMTQDFLTQFRSKLDSLNELLSFNQIFIRRSANIGVVTADEAIAYGWTGPILRASGVDWDLRRDEPYSIYDQFEFDVPVGQGLKGQVGDNWDRYWVRVQEMYQSMRILEQVIVGFPEGGEFKAKVPAVIRPPQGAEVYVRGECPRGEVAFYIISDGSGTPYRMKVRGPSFCNISALEAIAKDMVVADLVSTLGTFDLVMGEVDR
ncbi:MAG: NADH-quinone oxidoreductase subunit D [bacterium]|jgi:NADH-quinone oxidoreductase subunit D|nr:NADH-quinone oxidoreductase subunit D [bacterium]